jgi:general secretion pathway protein G
MGRRFMDKKRALKWSAMGITIIVILTVVSISRYQGVIRKSREAVLADNLTAIRFTIKQYIEDKQRAPQSLQDLAEAGYFRELPTDPITNSNSGWKPAMGTVVTSHGKTVQGITDLHSGSNSISSNGTIYNTW